MSAIAEPVPASDRPFSAGLIPDVPTIQSALEKAEQEAEFLRKLLRLALARETTPGQIMRLRKAMREGERHGA